MKGLAKVIPTGQEPGEWCSLALRRWATALPAMLLLLIAAASRPASAEDAFDRCVAGAGGPGQAALKAFDRELRQALSAEDSETLAILASFPVRVTSTSGATISLDNPAALQVRFEEVISPAVRKAVLEQEPEDLSCTRFGITYGAGNLVVQPRGPADAQYYAITTVSMRGKDQVWSSTTPRVEYACNAERQRVIIDDTCHGQKRYRAWKRPALISDEPTVLVESGTSRVDGIGACKQMTWVFKEGKSEYTLSEQPCPGADTPPNAKGSLDVVVNGKKQAKSWCY